MKKELTDDPHKIPCNLLRKLIWAITLTVTAVIGIGLHAPPAYAIYCANCSNFYQQMFQYAEEVNT